MKLKPIQKRKSTFDIDNATSVISGLIFLAILLAVLLLVIVIVFGLDVFATTGGANNISANITYIRAMIVTMVSNFFALLPTIGTILAVVVLIAGIVILVMYVKKMKDQGSSGTFQG